MNKDDCPNPENLNQIPFTQTIPDVSWYRHISWKPGQYKRFRHYHTIQSNIEGFEFFNEKNIIQDLEKMTYKIVDNR